MLRFLIVPKITGHTTRIFPGLGPWRTLTELSAHSHGRQGRGLYQLSRAQGERGPGDQITQGVTSLAEEREAPRGRPPTYFVCVTGLRLPLAGTVLSKALGPRLCSGMQMGSPIAPRTADTRQLGSSLNYHVCHFRPLERGKLAAVSLM